MDETLEETRARIRALVSGPGKTSRWIAKHLEHADEDWCLIYPFAWEEGAYPKWASRKPHYVVHRLMCEYRHGKSPSPKHHSAHSCNRGIEGCVNPMHVSWKTPSENQYDRHAGGTPVGASRKLTPEQVDEIRSLKGRMQPGDIAKQFGVTLRNIRMILNGQAWTSDPARSSRVFSAEEVALIRMTPWQEKSSKQFAEEFGVSRSTIDRIKQGISYQYYDLTRAPYVKQSPGKGHNNTP